MLKPHLELSQHFPRFQVDNQTTFHVYMEDVRSVEGEAAANKDTGPTPHVPAHFANEYGIMCGMSPIPVSTVTYLTIHHLIYSLSMCNFCMFAKCANVRS